MTARRRWLAAGSAVLSAAALAACEKPTPLVTLVSGGESVYREANVWCFEEGQTIASGECAEREEGVLRLPVRAGDEIGVDVGDELNDRGWTFTLVDPANPQGAQEAPLQEEHWFSFTAPNIPPGESLLLTVRTGESAQAANGEWAFELVPREE
jgi:hypothetical protein